MPIIEATTGHETLNQSSAKVYLWHSPTRDQRGMTEKFIGALVKEGSPLIRKVGVPTYIGAVIGIMPEIGGQWVKQRYDVAEGQILKVFGTKNPAWGKLKTRACQFIRVRAEAPLQRIKVKLLGVPQTKLKYAEITGRFDILTLDEAKARGVTVNPQFEHTFHDANTSRLFETEILEPAISKVEAKMVADTAGVPMLVEHKKELRSMELDD